MKDDSIKAMKEQLLTGIQLQFSAKPVLVKLAEMLDETICLAVPSGEQLLVVDMVSSSRSSEFSSFIGQRYSWPFSAEAEGFAEEINAYFYQLESAGEGPPINSRMIKVPLWNGQQKVCGWLCLIGLVEPLTPKRLRKLFLVLRAAGESLSVSLSKEWP